VAPVLVLGIGNPSRGDDALGPRLMERLAQRQAEGSLCQCALLCDYQLQIEHALALAGRRRVIFVDASATGPAPYELSRVVPERNSSWSTHAARPGAVLDVLARLGPEIGADQPHEVWLLAVRGYAFELGAPLSLAAQTNLDAAAVFLEGFVEVGEEPRAG